jgi:signal transduction histidine kinase
VLLLGLGAGVLIARQLARPLSGLEATARDISAGNLSSRATVEGTSEQRSLAGSFNQMTGRLERALRSQREFVADASHQLRTPLTGLRLRLEEAQATPSKAESDAEVQSALGEVDRLAHTVDELLILSRAGERDAPGEAVDLAEAARSAVERWRRAAGDSGMRLELSDGPAAGAWCARSDIDRALDVLLENALVYSGRGATITVLARDGCVEVLDTGPGLEPGEEEQVFERFHRGSAGRGGPAGSGLGLSIARELMQRWGGTATIVNRPEGGARAVLSLPSQRDRFTGSLPAGS